MLVIFLIMLVVAGTIAALLIWLGLRDTSKPETKYIEQFAEADQITIIEQCRVFNEKAEEAKAEHNTIQYTGTEKANNECPRGCKGNSTDKFHMVTGSSKMSGSVSGNLFGVSGSMSGSGSISTQAVNRCPVCEHEWEKVKWNYKSLDDFIEDKLDRLRYYIEEFAEKGRVSTWRKDDEYFRDLSIESIYKLAEDVISGSRSLTYFTERVTVERLEQAGFKRLPELKGIEQCETQ